jgi:hypothetical protein
LFYFVFEGRSHHSLSVLGLALNSPSSSSSISWIAGITGTHHHTWPRFYM